MQEVIVIFKDFYSAYIHYAFLPSCMSDVNKMWIFIKQKVNCVSATALLLCETVLHKLLVRL